MSQHDPRISLTIYNQGTSLVRDRRVISLDDGLVTLDFTDVTAQIDATSVTLTAPDDPEGTLVLEQNYLYDLVGTYALLKRYLEQTIEITVDDGAHFVGQLLSSDSDLILRLSEGQIATVSLGKIRDMRFPALPGGLITRPTLRWLLQSAKAGERTLELTYLSGGMNWTADYNILLAKDNASINVSGWVTLDNTSGASFTDAQVKLVAGDVKRLPEPRVRGKVLGAASDTMYAMSPQQVEQRELFEYQLYEINRLVTVADKETKQVEFINVPSVPATIDYIYDPQPGFVGYANQAVTAQHMPYPTLPISMYLKFSTGDKGGIGKDLPAGRIRVYQEDTDGGAVLIGENQIKHTPKGEQIALELGKAFDLVAERKQTSFHLTHKNRLEETYEIHLRNRKDTTAVQIRVHERLFRWSNWEILNSSHPFTPLDSSSIEFRVDVPPGEEVMIAYTVRYSWPG
jgi:hypothetical protein